MGRPAGKKWSARAADDSYRPLWGETVSTAVGQATVAVKIDAGRVVNFCEESKLVYASQIPGLEQKIQQLEKETAQPERREAARARKKLIKDVQRNLSEAGTDADKVKYLENVFSEQVLFVFHAGLHFLTYLLVEKASASFSVSDYSASQT